jgi:hypothetical protein
MRERIALRMLLHGAVLLLVGLLAGMVFGVAVAQSWREDAVRAWRVAHAGSVGLGVMLLAIGAVLDRLQLRERTARAMAWSLVTLGYTFAFGAVFAATAGVRGLTPDGAMLNAVVFATYLVGSVGAVLGVALVILGAYAALTRALSSSDFP